MLRAEVPSEERCKVHDANHEGNHGFMQGHAALDRAAPHWNLAAEQRVRRPIVTAKVV